MNIEEFYAGDEKRRYSAEFSYGLMWRSEQDESSLYDLFWVQDTGEVYLMRKPAPPEWPHFVHHDRYGEVGVIELAGELLHPRHRDAKEGAPSPVGSDVDFVPLEVEVVAVVDSRAALESAIAGWENEMARADGVEWLKRCLTSKT